jgi:hypothetical protein
MPNLGLLIQTDIRDRPLLAQSGRSCANGVFEIVIDKEGWKWSQRRSTYAPAWSSIVKSGVAFAGGAITLRDSVVRYAGSSERQTERQATVSDRRPGAFQPASRHGTTAHIMPRHVRSDLGKPLFLACAMRSRLSVWRLDADEVHVLQEPVEAGDTQDPDLDVTRTV